MGSQHNFSKVVSKGKKIDWFTPLDLLEEVRAFFGEIDLDPAHPDMDNGLMMTWRGRVFLNPPYGWHIKEWIDRAMTDPVDEIILLVPSNTASKWFQPLFQHTICFLNHRLEYRDCGRGAQGAPFASVLVYRGYRPEAFARAFVHRGHVMLGAPAQPQVYQLPLEVA